MENVKNIEKTELYQERVNELFKELTTEDFYARWEDTFEIESVEEKEILLVYSGSERMKTFKKECKKTLFSCIYSVVGTGKKIKVVKKGHSTPLPPKAKKNLKAVKFFALGMVFVCIATAVVIVLCSYIGNRNFRETFYITSSIKVDSRVRIVQLSDLHGSSYGRENQKLLHRVKMLQPDIILCTGDMVDSTEAEADYAVSLAAELAKIAPAYYVYGNNEVEGIYDIPLHEKELDEKFGFTPQTRDEAALLTLEDPFEAKLEAAGIKVLKNETDTIAVKTMNVDVYGVLTSNPSSFWSYSGTAYADFVYGNPDNLKIMAVHEPFIFEEFAPEYWADLMVCGHTHGGVVRLPILGPLFTHEGGLLPERSGDFVYGKYNTAGSPLIVSAGLENSNILRINNQPELVIIDINKF